MINDCYVGGLVGPPATDLDNVEEVEISIECRIQFLIIYN
jgi:hypothetical protein